MTLEELPEPAPKSVVVTVKPWWQSKVVWLAVLMGLLGAAEALSSNALLGPELVAWALFAKSVLDLILRKFTGQPIGGSA